MNAATAALVFSMFDVDGDGQMDAMELQAALSKLGSPVELDVARAFLGRVDSDRTGVLDRAQFMQLLKLPAPAPELLRSFRAFDLDGDGYVDASELNAMFASVGIEDPTTVDELVAELDRDGDGRVDLGEFMQMASAEA